MKNDACPKCGSTKRERGEISQKGSLWDVRFMPKTSFGLSPKKKIAALACSSCGYIELFLVDHDEPEAV